MSNLLTKFSLLWFKDYQCEDHDFLKYIHV